MTILASLIATAKVSLAHFRDVFVKLYAEPIEHQPPHNGDDKSDDAFLAAYRSSFF